VIEYLKTFGKYQPLLRELVKRDLKTKYRRSILGYLWSLLNPLLMMCVITAVFSYMFRFNIDNFPIYLLTAQILFNFLSESTTMAMSSLINNANIISKVYVPKYIFPLSRVLSSFVNLLFSLAAILIMLVLTSTRITPAILLFPLPLLLLLLFCIGLGMLLALLATYFRDILHLYGVVITAWTYLTPIFYPFSILPKAMQELMRFTPMFHYISVFREVIMYERADARSILVCPGLA
jgi:ABC-2 type transport system permease protein